MANNYLAPAYLRIVTIYFGFPSYNIITSCARKQEEINTYTKQTGKKIDTTKLHQNKTHQKVNTQHIYMVHGTHLLNPTIATPLPSRPHHAWSKVPTLDVTLPPERKGQRTGRADRQVPPAHTLVHHPLQSDQNCHTYTQLAQK